MPPRSLDLQGEEVHGHAAVGPNGEGLDAVRGLIAQHLVELAERRVRIAREQDAHKAAARGILRRKITDIADTSAYRVAGRALVDAQMFWVHTTMERVRHEAQGVTEPAVWQAASEEQREMAAVWLGEGAGAVAVVGYNRGLAQVDEPGARALADLEPLFILRGQDLSRLLTILRQNGLADGLRVGAVQWKPSPGDRAEFERKFAAWEASTRVDRRANPGARNRR